VYSTFVSGSDDDVGNAIAIDAHRNVFVTGETSSTDFPVTPGTFHREQARPISTDVFVVRLSADGTALKYATHFGGTFSTTNSGSAIAVDGADNAYVTGSTLGEDFPTSPGAFQRTGGRYGDAFVVKLDRNGQLGYSTYLAGSGSDYGLGIAARSSGNAYVLGRTSSPDFPTTGAPLPSGPRSLSFYTCFLVKLNAEGTALAYSSYLGGGTDQGFGIALDSSGGVYVAGSTGSPD